MGRKSNISKEEDNLILNKRELKDLLKRETSKSLEKGGKVGAATKQ
jgi:hypothetical protein